LLYIAGFDRNPMTRASYTGMQFIAADCRKSRLVSRQRRFRATPGENGSGRTFLGRIRIDRTAAERRPAQEIVLLGNFAEQSQKLNALLRRQGRHGPFLSLRDLDLD
jgi:hypothetical protein